MLQVLYTGVDGVEKVDCNDPKDVLETLRKLQISQSSLITVYDLAHSGSMTSTRNVLVRALELENLENLLRY